MSMWVMWDGRIVQKLYLNKKAVLREKKSNAWEKVKIEKGSR